MDKFRDIILKISENATAEQKTLIQDRLNKFTANFTTPDHLPYAAMIYRALENLNEKRGSSEESISLYIRKNFSGLPLAHNSLLKHHLGKLCETGEVVVSTQMRYSLAGGNPNVEPRVMNKKGRPKKGQKGRACKKNESEQLVEAGSQLLEKEQGYAICTPLVVDSNVQQQNETDILTPEKPPGFEFGTAKELSQSVEQTKDLLHLQVVPISERRLSQVELQIVQHEGQNLCEWPGSAPSTIMSNLLQQHPPLSNSYSLQEGKTKHLDVLEDNPKPLKQYGRRKKVNSQTKETKAIDVPIDSGHIKQNQQSDLSGPVKSLGLELTILESSDTEKQQQSEICMEQEVSEFPTGAIISVDPKKLDKEKQPDKSLEELKQLTAKSKMELEQRQEVRRSQRIASRQTITSLGGLLPSSQLLDGLLGQQELRSCELPTELIKQNPLEASCPITKQQAKLLSRQKHKTSQPNMNICSLESTLNSEMSQLHVQESAHIIEQRENLSHRKQKGSQPNTVLRSPDASRAQKQVGATGVKDWRSKLCRTGTAFLPSPMALEKVEGEGVLALPCLEIQTEASEDRRVALTQGKPASMELCLRPVKPQLEAGISPKELLPSFHHHDKVKQSERRNGRGRLSKTEPDTVETQQVQSEDQNHYQQPAQLTGGRSPKQTAVAEEQNPTYGGRGRPLKPTQTTLSTSPCAAPSQQDQQPKCQRRGRSRKMDQGSK